MCASTIGVRVEEEGRPPETHIWKKDRTLQCNVNNLACGRETVKIDRNIAGMGEGIPDGIGLGVFH